MKSIPTITVGDILELKKPHPCGEHAFKVLRVGSDIKISCVGCGRALILERVKLEKMIKCIKNSDKGGNSDGQI
ncbi:MAG: DUF951 domain-containing protein [Clostridia bacterium]|nr:DUF951 domain-containing protein [Clostridia bacterium]